MQGKPELNTKIDYVNKFIAEEIAKRRKWFQMDVDLMTTDYKKSLHFNKMGTAKYAHEISISFDPSNLILDRGISMEILSMSL